MPEKYFEYAIIGDGGVLIWWWDSSAQQHFEKRLEGEERDEFLSFLDSQSESLQTEMARVAGV